MNKKVAVALAALIVLSMAGYVLWTKDLLPFVSSGQFASNPDGSLTESGERLYQDAAGETVYYTDKGQVYYTRPDGSSVLVSEKAASFRLLSEGVATPEILHAAAPVYATDDENVFAGYIAISYNNTDPQTFKVLDPIGIAKDSDTFYIGSRPIEGWYPDGFRIQWPSTYYYSSNNQNLQIFAAINANPVVLNLSTGEVRSMPGIDIDINTFSVVDSGEAQPIYAKDKNHVYCWGEHDLPRVIVDADPFSFRTPSEEDKVMANQRATTIDARDADHVFNDCLMIGSAKMDTGK